MRKLLTLLMILIGQQLFAAGSEKTWNDIKSSDALKSGIQAIKTTHCRLLQLNMDEMRQLLNSAPVERTQDARSRKTIIELPMPDGSFQQFSIVEASVCAPALAARYPETKTWAGQGIDDPASTVRLDITPWGFHSMILSNQGEIFVDPYNQQTTEIYICYNKNDAIRSSSDAPCLVDQNKTFDKKQVEELKLKHKSQKNVPTNAGDILSVYRLALACNGDYAAIFPPATKASVHAAMVTSVNRVVGVYEKELDIRMELIPNNDDLIYFTIGTPYSNISGSAILNTNQSNIDAVIGNGNYDIGHVFTTGSGGIASFESVCNASYKAQGTTGVPNPVGDAFDIDFVAHEMGHQFGGSHTFNAISSNCGGGNRSALAAFEPGSGITIMAYAGTCGAADNLSKHSIPYMHTHSFSQIEDYITFGDGATCPITFSTTNNPPFSLLSNYYYEIPVNTPFVLTGAGGDPDLNPLTYSWEEYDYEGAKPTGNTCTTTPATCGCGRTWNAATTCDAPIFMSYAPTVAPWRLFPKLANILNNSNSIGELKPSYARLMNFRLTLRDNQLGGGGVTYDNPVQVNVTGTTPFAITYPNTAGISWTANSSQTITWNVSGTNLAPISTPNVNIYLSDSGGLGYPFPVLIASNVPNNGSYTFNVPNKPTTKGRILVEGANNIFFDINDKDFTITSSTGINEGISNESISIKPNPAKDVMQLEFSGSLRGKVDVRLNDVSGRLVQSRTFLKLQSTMTENIDISELAKGVYLVTLVTESGTSIQRLIKN